MPSPKQWERPVRLLVERRMTDSLPREVLIVEDEPMTRIVAADAVAERGIMVWEAADADEALQVLTARPRVGLLFTDVNMPGDLDGLQLAEKATEIRPGLELIVTSGARRILDGDLPDHGTFLPKPYHPDQLAALVSAKLDDD